MEMKRFELTFKKEEFGTTIPLPEVEKRIRGYFEGQGYITTHTECHGAFGACYTAIKKPSEKLWHVLFLNIPVQEDGLHLPSLPQKA